MALYDQKTFSEVFEDVDAFVDGAALSGLPVLITEASLTTLYYLLSGRYGNSHIANKDEDQFTLKVYSIIFQYAPTWEKRLAVQAKVRGLSLEDADLNAWSAIEQINNHAYNPSTVPVVGELTTINEQTKGSMKKSKLGSYAALSELLETDVTEELISRFKHLFVTIISPSFLYEDEEV